tara:strand:- start:871 stop:1332 length:462 start_codon:yes stop_codon:yes gene_type:complete
MIRYFKKCEEFTICSEFGESNLLFTETSNERNTIYQIVVKGSGRVGKIFDSEYTRLDNNNNFVDLKKYLGSDTVFQSYTPFHIYGFNKIDNLDWDGKLVTESFKGDDKTWLICFKGNPIINGRELQIMDYAKLENKFYDVNLNDAIVGVFTKL